MNWIRRLCYDLFGQRIGGEEQMMLISIAILIILALYVVSVYNSLQTIKTRIRASIQEIGNQLKRQADLIPNLEASVKGYLTHEKSIFKQLTDARKAIADAGRSGTMAAVAEASGQLQKLIPALQIIVESNPQIKADTTVTRLMDELRDTSDKVMYARRTLIDLTADFNQKLITFPSNVVANMFGFKAEKGLETPNEGEFLNVSGDETVAPKIKI